MCIYIYIYITEQVHTEGQSEQMRQYNWESMYDKLIAKASLWWTTSIFQTNQLLVGQITVETCSHFHFPRVYNGKDELRPISQGKKQRSVWPGFICTDKCWRKLSTCMIGSIVDVITNGDKMWHCCLQTWDGNTDTVDRHQASSIYIYRAAVSKLKTLYIFFT